MCKCNDESKKRSAEGSNFKEYDRALPLLGVISLCLEEKLFLFFNTVYLIPEVENDLVYYCRETQCGRPPYKSGLFFCFILGSIQIKIRLVQPIIRNILISF